MITWVMFFIKMLLFVAFIGLFYRFVPWLLASDPIDKIVNHEVSNLPPPEGALSFSINHGSAIYYFEPIPSEAPIFTLMVVSAFIGVSFGLFILNKKAKSLGVSL